MAHPAHRTSHRDGPPLLSVPIIVVGAGALSSGLALAVSRSLVLGVLTAVLTTTTVIAAALMIRA